MGYCQQYASLWPAGEQDTAQAVCMAESGGDPNAQCISCTGVPERSRGLYQVNGMAWPQFDSDSLFDPATNAQAALSIWQIQGWNAWGSYKAGRYRQFLGSPLENIQPTVFGLPLQPVAQMGGLLVIAAIAAYLLASS